MRFEDRTDPGTRIKIMTDGILLQEIKADYSLSRYGVIMVDEAHERSLNIDFILGLLKQLLAERPSFKVIVSSATINAEVFSEYFDECPIVTIESSPYPVELRYEPPRQPGSPDSLLDKIAEIVERTVRDAPASRARRHPDLPARRGGHQELPDPPGGPADSPAGWRSCRCTRDCPPRSRSGCSTTTPAGSR